MTCTCQHPDDTCPACYADKKAKLQESLWEATCNLARLQQEALALDLALADHRRYRLVS